MLSTAKKKENAKQAKGLSLGLHLAWHNLCSVLPSPALPSESVGSSSPPVGRAVFVDNCGGPKSAYTEARGNEVSFMKLFLKGKEPMTHSFCALSGAS